MAKINLGDWDFNQYSHSGGPKGGGHKAYGQADFEKLKSMGANNAQLSLLGGVANKKGIKIGQWVRNNLPSANPWAYAKYGNWDMGMKDVNAAIDQGKSDEDIRGYIQHAMDNDINVGSRAQDWFKLYQNPAPMPPAVEPDANRPTAPTPQPVETLPPPPPEIEPTPPPAPLPPPTPAPAPVVNAPVQELPTAEPVSKEVETIQQMNSTSQGYAVNQSAGGMRITPRQLETTGTGAFKRKKRRPIEVSGALAINPLNV